RGRGGPADRARARAARAPLEARLLARRGHLGDLGAKAGRQLRDPDDVVLPALAIEGKGRRRSDGSRGGVGGERAALRIADLYLGDEVGRGRVNRQLRELHRASCVEDEPETVLEAAEILAVVVLGHPYGRGVAVGR